MPVSPAYCARHSLCFCFFFNDTATTEIYTLSLHDALPICCVALPRCGRGRSEPEGFARGRRRPPRPQSQRDRRRRTSRSEEHTSELQSRPHLVCRLLLEEKTNLRAQHVSTTRATLQPVTLT